MLNVKERLTPRETGRFVAQHAKLVTIDHDEIEKVAVKVLEAMKSGDMMRFSAPQMHPQGGQKAVDWVFLADSINFSFWPDEGKKFTIFDGEQDQTGYFACCAAINNAIKDGFDLTNAAVMEKLCLSHVEKYLTSKSGDIIPMIDERIEILRENGKILREKFGGSFLNVVMQCENSAEKLLRLIVEHFPSFRDFGELHGAKLSFLKRAQILVLDVFWALKGEDYANFKDIDCLTMFADYRVPQILAYFGVLKYDASLMAKISAKEHLEAGGAEEMELRGCSIYAVDLIVEKIKELRGTSEFASCTEVNAADVDVFLWMSRRLHAADIEQKVGMHRTRTIYY